MRDKGGDVESPQILNGVWRVVISQPQEATALASLADTFTCGAGKHEAGCVEWKKPVGRSRV